MKPDEIIALEKRLSEYQGEDKMISSHDLQEELKKSAGTVFSFKTDIPAMDRILDRVEAGELIVVTGGTGAGKTTLLQSITKNIADETPCAWFTLEVTQRQFIQKFGNHVPLFYTPAKNTDNNVNWLIERIIEAKLKYNVSMIFVDHLHGIFSLDRFNGKNLSLEIGDIVAKLKNLAIEYNLVIWLIAHGTDNKLNTTAEPKMTDVRDSGMVIRYADIVLGVWRIPTRYNGSENNITELEENDNRTKVRIWKNRRNGKLGFFVMEFTDGRLVEKDTSKEIAQEKEDKKDGKNKYSKRLNGEPKGDRTDVDW